ncbi:glycoside hydrolase family 88 protein [Aquiflexum sp.]|uniref:glycoside hydrolase family 88 protein n=1 Tax=Aquiflexum sp. TaxID=1872584 RepID=UPI00359434B0
MCLGLLFAFQKSNAQGTEIMVEKVIDHWLSLHNNFSSAKDAHGNYTIDLTLEAMMVYGNSKGTEKYLDLAKQVLALRGISAEDTISYRSQPFGSMNFLIGKYSENNNWFKGYVAESSKMRQEVARSEEGAIMINHQGGHYILIDYLQEYASRMAKTGFITDDPEFYREAVQQYQIYKNIVQNPENGLYSQGRGWLDDKSRLSPGAWSRGHGWLLRGLVTSMMYLPEEYRDELLPILKEVVDSLQKVQSKDGMWYIMLHLPKSESYPDVSGTGMIAYYMSVAVREGWLSGKSYKRSIMKAHGRLKDFITESGQVLSSSKGPGPLYSTEEYIRYRPEIDEKHGFQGMIYGLLARNIIESR